MYHFPINFQCGICGDPEHPECDIDFGQVLGTEATFISISSLIWTLCRWPTTVGFVSAIHTVPLSITEEGLRKAAGFVVTWVSALLWELHAVDLIWTVLTLRCAVAYKLHVYTLPAMSALELVWRVESLKYVKDSTTDQIDNEFIVFLLQSIPFLHLRSQFLSSDPSLQSFSPSHTWLYRTHSFPSLQGLDPRGHFRGNEALATTLVSETKRKKIIWPN